MNYQGIDICTSWTGSKPDFKLVYVGVREINKRGQMSVPSIYWRSKSAKGPITLIKIFLSLLIAKKTILKQSPPICIAHLGNFL